MVGFRACRELFSNTFSAILLIALILYPAFTSSQDIQEVRPISFGSVVVLNNDTAGSIEIDSVGNVTASTHFAFIVQPEHGIFRLINYPPNARLFLSGGIIQGQTTSTQYSPEQFTLTTVNLPVSISIENDGTAEFRAGGLLITSGSGNTTFANTTYTSRLLITVNY